MEYQIEKHLDSYNNNFYYISTLNSIMVTEYQTCQNIDLQILHCIESDTLSMQLHCSFYKHNIHNQTLVFQVYYPLFKHTPFKIFFCLLSQFQSLSTKFFYLCFNLIDMIDDFFLYRKRW